MTNGTKEYKIVINGLTESVTAVDSLNKQLSELENRIKALEKSNVKVNTGGSTTSASNSSALKEEVAAQKELNQLKKEEAAQQRLIANEYANTMKGMKQNLADLKTVINTTDLGDDASIKKMTNDANELTNKLKEMEQAYGQYGRNVGNYANSIVEGLNKYKVQVGDTVREFNSAKEAARTLSNELLNLPKGAKGAEELRAALQQVKSEIQDLGKSSATMDNLLDTMEGFMAVANAGQGIRALFGVDDTEIQKSIKNLVALQNVLKGIETINKQINTREGIGKWIAPFTTQVDKATTKLLAFNTALLGTGKASKVAATGIKLFSKALKVAFSAGILIAVDLLVDKLMDLVENFKKVDEAAEREKQVQKELAEAYGQAQGKLIQYKAKVDSFNGSKKEEKKLVEELNKEFGSTLGTYKSIAEWQDVLKKKGEAYIQTLINQAKAQAALNEVTAAYMNLESVRQKIANGDYSHWYQTRQQDAEAAAKAEEEANKRIAKAEENLRKTIENNDNYAKSHGIGNYAPQIEKNTDKSKKALEEEQRTLNELQLRLMKEGLNKKLKQLDEEERQTINKLKENGRKNSETIKRVESAYTELRKKEIEAYLKSVEESVRKTARELANIQFSLDLKDIDNEINNLQNKLDELGKNVPKNMTLSSRSDFKGILGRHSNIEYAAVRRHNFIKDFADKNKTYDDYYSYMYKYISQKNDEIKAKFNEIYDETIGSDAEKKKAQYSFAEKIFQDEFREVLDIIRDYGENITNSFDVLTKNDTDILNNSFKARLESTNKYWRETKELIIKNLKEQSKLKEKAIKEQAEKEFEAERETYRNQYNSLSERANKLDNDIKGFTPKNSDDETKLKKMNEELNEVYRQMETAATQHSTKMAQINDAMLNAIKKNTFETNESISSEEEKYFSTRLSDYRDFQSKLNDELSKNPVTDKAGFGIVNINQTKKNYEEILKASKTAINGIKADKDRLDSLYKGGFIDKEAYNSTLRQLNEVEQEIKNGVSLTAEHSKQLVGDFIQSINQYVQIAGQAIQEIMSSIWDAQDYQFEKEQEELDKYNDKLDKALDKQQDIVEKHKSAIDSIEDELATARGSRRQHLIDQLNSEMEAQREAQKQEQEIQKQKEAAEKKKEQLEKKRRQEEYDRNVKQAFINWHLSIASGLATQPFMPLGIAMGALATVLGGVQYALVKSQKPYAKGGLLEGKSHAQGGIPVGNTGIEVEGKEYVIRKKSTAPNIDLLDYINKSERKLDLNDFIDFYAGDKPKKVIRSVRSKFEDGGYMPSLPNSLDVREQLQNIVVNQDNRPIYVSVVDINNKQDDVRRVQTLAGLKV